jgi:hypothetical protein
VIDLNDFGWVQHIDPDALARQIVDDVQERVAVRRALAHIQTLGGPEIRPFEQGGNGRDESVVSTDHWNGTCAQAARPVDDPAIDLRHLNVDETEDRVVNASRKTVERRIFLDEFSVDIEIAEDGVCRIHLVELIAGQPRVIGLERA